MENKEFYKILVTIQDLIADPNYEMLSAYVDSSLTKVELEMKSEETWLDRLEEATDGEYPTSVSGNPTICLSTLLGYDYCFHVDEKYTCLECWKTPVKEIGPVKAEGEI